MASTGFHKASSRQISRRSLLRAAGVSMALPLLDAMRPALGATGAESATNAAGATSAAGAASPGRMVAINIPLGFHGPNFFPEQVGRDYAITPLLKPAEALRDRFTIFSGTSHPDVDGGHSAEKSFLTAAPHPQARSFSNTISLDQFAAGKIGAQTRFASMTLGDHSMSWSATGVSIPAEQSPTTAFAKLFLEGNKQEVAAQISRLQDRQSILDTVLDDAKSMQRVIGPADRHKLDQYFNAVRETEQRLAKADAWSKTPKPTVDAKPPAPTAGQDFTGRLRAHFDVIRLALQTDSTRVVTLGGDGGSAVPPLKGVNMGYHTLSHHGKNPQMMEQLAIIESATIQAWADFLLALQHTPDGDSNLLDRTQVLLGSNLGNANGHQTTNLPIVLAGGGFKHGQHLAFDARNNYPLANLFVSMLQRLGVEASGFASSTGTMRGLEMQG